MVSIGAVGLINNLAVKPNGKRGQFEVVAGGRRLTALQALVKSGALKATDTVPCRVIEGEGGNAEVVSLSENIHRQAMHPADEFVAFQTLIEAGLSVKEVAAQYGTTQAAVNKRLKLAGVAPQILVAYRQGDMDLECVMAFTVAAEHKRQLAVWKAIKGGYVADHTIRRALTENRWPSDHRLVTFITVAAYTDAGGVITEDLFKDVCYLDDVELVQRLAIEKLDVEGKRLEKAGWGWVEVSLMGDSQGMGRIVASAPETLPKKLRDEEAKLAAKETAFQALHTKTEGDLTDKQAADWEALDDAMGALQEKINALATYDPAEMALAGCVLSVDWSGESDLTTGLVRKTDKKALKALQTGDAATANSEGGGTGGEAPKADEATPTGYAQSLKDDLTAYRLAIAKAELAKNPAVANDLLGYSLAVRVLDDVFAVVGLDATCTITPTRSSRGDIEGSALEAAIEATREKLSLGWLGKKSDAKKFEAYCALKPTEKAAMTAYCAAQSLKGQLADGGNAVIETALNRCQIDFAQHWRPTAENFFSRINKSALLALGDELAGDDWAHSHKHLKKVEMAERLEALTQGQGAALSKDQQTACLAWMPKGF